MRLLLLGCLSAVGGRRFDCERFGSSGVGILSFELKLEGAGTDGVVTVGVLYITKPQELRDSVFKLNFFDFIILILHEINFQPLS